MSDYFLLIPIVIAAIIIICTIIFIVNKSKKSNEDPASILDVNEVGVSSNSEFSYGYEKEETIVMNPVSEEQVENETNKEDFPDISDDKQNIDNTESEDN